MIKVSVDENEISVSGHAGYAPTGSDIVCAGVTTLVQTLISSFELTGDTPEMEIDSGFFRLALYKLTPKGLFMTEVFLKGIHMIAEEFPEYVLMHKNRERIKK